MKKFVYVLTALVALSASTITMSAQQITPQVMGGSNPRPQVMGGSNPRPQVMGGSNPRPQAVDTIYAAVLAYFGF